MIPGFTLNDLTMIRCCGAGHCSSKIDKAFSNQSSAGSFCLTKTLTKSEAKLIGHRRSVATAEREKKEVGPSFS